MSFVKRSVPHTGDIIRTKRKFGYYHFGIAINENEVIHYSGRVNDNVTNANQVEIIKTSLDMFLRGDELEINYPYNSPYSPDEVVERALSYLGQKRFDNKPYNFITNNCEHFARYIYFNIKESKQVLLGAIVAAISVSTITTILSSTAIITNNIKKNRDNKK